MSNRSVALTRKDAARPKRQDATYELTTISMQDISLSRGKIGYTGQTLYARRHAQLTSSAKAFLIVKFNIPKNRSCWRMDAYI
jgi:hypothetical protein